jgi:hypothetical protein
MLALQFREMLGSVGEGLHKTGTRGGWRGGKRGREGVGGEGRMSQLLNGLSNTVTSKRRKPLTTGHM